MDNVTKEIDMGMKFSKRHPEDMTPAPKAGGVAKRTWKRGFVHLTVDGTGLVSLWDSAMTKHESYVKLPLTKAQQKLIEATMKKNGYTP